MLQYDLAVLNHTTNTIIELIRSREECTKIKAKTPKAPARNNVTLRKYSPKKHRNAPIARSITAIIVLFFSANLIISV